MDENEEMQQPSFEDALEKLKKDYAAIREIFMADDDRDECIAASQKREQGLRAAVKSLYREFRDDGNLFPVILGTVLSKSLGASLMTTLLSEGPMRFISDVCTDCTLPLINAWTAEMQRQDIEEEINRM